MERDEVFENRREIARKLLTSLRESGRLGASDHFSVRPYHDGEKKFRFSAANYLRLAAMNYHYGDLHDPRWYTMEDISRNGWELKEYARPEQLEVWEISPDGKKKCDMVDFYHVTDLPDREILPDKETTLKECLTDLQEKNVLAVSDKTSLLDGLHAVQDYARKNGANEPAAVVASQMWLTESGFRPSYDIQRGLYSAELLNAMEKHPDILFSAAHKAQEMLIKLNREPKQKLPPVKNEPFADLEVIYYWCETDIKDTAGETYQRDCIFTGRAAYEFLARYNSMDKHSFNEKITGNSGYHKSEIALRYKDYDHGEMRIDLGDLELGNRTSIADALIHRLDMYRRNLLQDPDAAKRHWTENQQEGQNTRTYEDFLAAVKKESAEFRELMEVFRREEDAYLEQYPELATINQERANTFLYTVKVEDFDKISYGIVIEKISETIPEGHLLKEADFAVKDYIATYPGNPIPYQSNKERIAQVNLVSGKVVTFSSGWQPTDIAERVRRGKLPPVLVSVSPEEQELLQKLDGFKLNITYEPKLEIIGHKRNSEYNGYLALNKLNEELQTEGREAQTAVEQRCSLCGEQVNFTLYYNDEPIFEANYESGKQQLFAAVNEQGGIIPEHLREPIATICKYLSYDSSPMELLRKEHRIWENFPTMEESRESYIRDCRPDIDEKDVHPFANYYSIVTLLNPEVQSKADFSRCMVEEMVQDGISQNRMNKIVDKSRLNPDIREKVKQVIQSAETKSALRKAKVQKGEAIEAPKIQEGR